MLTLVTTLSAAETKDRANGADAHDSTLLRSRRPDDSHAFMKQSGSLPHPQVRQVTVALGSVPARYAMYSHPETTTNTDMKNNILPNPTAGARYSADIQAPFTSLPDRPGSPSNWPVLRAWLPSALILALGLVSVQTALAQLTYQRLKSFGFPLQSGTTPEASVIEGSDGALYGTTYSGGIASGGTVFKMNRDGSGYTVLHS